MASGDPFVNVRVASGTTVQPAAGVTVVIIGLWASAAGTRMQGINSSGTTTMWMGNGYGASNGDIVDWTGNQRLVFTNTEYFGITGGGFA